MLPRKLLLKCLACCVRISTNDILQYFSYTFQKIGFDISYKLPPVETICKKCQSLFTTIKDNNKTIRFKEMLNMPKERGKCYVGRRSCKVYRPTVN